MRSLYRQIQVNIDNKNSIFSFNPGLQEGLSHGWTGLCSAH